MNLVEQHTIWGAPCGHPVQAVGLLRAHAVRAGFPLTPVSAPDAAVAVVAAEAWWLAVGATTFEHPARHGDAALAAFCRILVIASGDAEPTAEEHDAGEANCAVPTAWFVAAATWMTWLESLGVSPSAMAAAATSLAVGQDDRRIATMCSVLTATADT